MAARWPAESDPRFKKEKIVKAITEALREAGVAGKITDVDCREYPCIIGGQLEGDLGPGVFKKLRNTRAWAPYAKDSAMTTMSKNRRTRSDGTNYIANSFGVSVMPRGDENTGPSVRRRTGYRLGQLMEALSGN